MDTGAPATASSASSKGVTNAAVDKAGITMATASHVLMTTARHALSSGHSAINAKMDMSQTAMHREQEHCIAIECGYLMAARVCSTKQATKAVQQQRQAGVVGVARMGKTRKRRQVKEEIDIAYEYVGMKRAGTVMMSRSGRQVKPKVYADELVGDGAFLAQIDSKTRDADVHSSAEDCESPIGEDTRRQIVGDDDGKKTSSGGRRGGKSGKGSGGGIFKAAAVSILQEEGRLMSTGDIAKLALRRGLIKCSGKTPEATMASALYTDIKRKVGESTFIRPREGLFGLKEWEERYMCGGERPCVGSSVAKNTSSAHDGNANVNPYDTVDNAVDASREHNVGEQQDGGASGANGEDAPAVGSASGGMQQHNPPRDGLIDLWSAAEKIDQKKKRRKVLITAVDAPARVSLPVMRKKASIIADSVPQEQESAGEKGSVVFKKEPQREEACVQSPRRETLCSHQHKDASICMDSEMCETMLFQLRLIRYCIENPNDSSKVCAENAVRKMEDTIKSYLTQITAQEDLNNRTAEM
ncbi:hypothetical protein M9435_001229 [Picochlorum sp. BPE23]|nr:hypothetical protein M9435_001229 [Picochlorum sp. BPE23]